MVALGSLQVERVMQVNSTGKNGFVQGEGSVNTGCHVLTQMVEHICMVSVLGWSLCTLQHRTLHVWVLTHVSLAFTVGIGIPSPNSC